MTAGAGAAGRATAQALVDAYIVLLAGHFHLFCRSLHDEAVRATVAMAPPTLRRLLTSALSNGLRLHRANATPAAMASDFQRLDMNLWHELERSSPTIRRHRLQLERLIIWRNAIAHQDFHLLRTR